MDEYNDEAYVEAFGDPNNNDLLNIDDAAYFEDELSDQGFIDNRTAAEIEREAINWNKRRKKTKAEELDEQEFSSEGSDDSEEDSYIENPPEEDKDSDYDPNAEEGTSWHTASIRRLENRETKKQSLPTHYKQPDIDSDLTDAYQQSKENLQGIIDQGQEAMYEILEIAKAGQHPRAFEVYATLLKNMTEANDRLLKIQKDMRDISGVKKEANTTNIDKAIFVGSTSELSKLLKSKD